MNTGSFLLLGAFTCVLALAAGWNRAGWWLAMVVLASGALVVAAGGVLAGGETWRWRPGLVLGGESVFLQLDRISAVFLALLGVVGGAASIYARAYWSEDGHPVSARQGRIWWTLLLASITSVLLAANGLHFLFAWEVFTVSSYFLITLDRQKPGVREAGWLYLTASHVATLGLFALFAVLAAEGGTWELGPLRDRLELAPWFWLGVVGFGVKAGMFPLHIWLPSAHANAPSHVSAIMSGVTIKLGIYGLVRLNSWLPAPDAAGWALTGLGVVSAVLGVAFALGQHDLKRLLAYHSVENIGIILIGVGLALIAVQAGNLPWGRLALAGGLLHVWNHGLFKALLFLGAGSVLHATGTREMSALGGLWRSMPWTATLFGVGAVAIVGLPPLNGFVSEWLIYLGLFDAFGEPGAVGLLASGALVLLAVTGALALACFVKVCGVVFLGAPRTVRAGRAHESPVSMRVPMVALALLCVAIGLGPVCVWPLIEGAVAEWQPAWAGLPRPESLPLLNVAHGFLAAVLVVGAYVAWRIGEKNGLRRGLTWDCGYAKPSARMQYTAGSFADMIVEWFAWILRPVRHAVRPEDILPAKASWETHTPETVLDHVVVPGGIWLLGWAQGARRFQHGRVQAYLGYLVLGLIALTFVALAGGSLS